jgi:hypothetical protein
MPITISDPRERLLVAEALVFAIEAYSRLPRINQPGSDIDDLKNLVNDMAMSELTLHQEQARRRIDWLIAGDQS